MTRTSALRSNSTGWRHAREWPMRQVKRGGLPVEEHARCEACLVTCSCSIMPPRFHSQAGAARHSRLENRRCSLRVPAAGVIEERRLVLGAIPVTPTSGGCRHALTRRRCSSSSCAGCTASLPTVACTLRAAAGLEAGGGFSAESGASAHHLLAAPIRGERLLVLVRRVAPAQGGESGCACAPPLGGGAEDRAGIAAMRLSASTLSARDAGGVAVEAIVVVGADAAGPSARRGAPRPRMPGARRRASVVLGAAGVTGGDS